MAGARHPRERQPTERAAGELRRRAEERLDGLSAAAPMPEDAAAVIHELRVYQIELEIQNEELRGAQLELDAQREKYFELFDVAPVGYLVLGDRGVVAEANFTAAHLLGVERQSLIGQPLSAFVVAPGHNVFHLHLRMLEKTEAPQACELRLRRAGAEPFWAHLESRPRRPAGGESRRYLVSLTDVDERVLATEALRESEQKYRIVADNTYDWESWTAPDGSYVYVSPGCERVTGRSAAEFLADPGLLLAILHTDDCDRIREHLAAAAADESAQHEIVFRILTPAGDERAIDHRCKPVHGPDGAFLGRRASNRDITERTQAERQLKERMKELQALYGLAEIAARQGLSLDDLCQELADILPASWQYPQIACARTLIGQRELHTKDFTESAWRQSAPITVNGSVVGRIEVGYRQEMPEADEGPFLTEERLLIDALAERLGRIAERMQAEDEILQRNRELADLNAELVDEAAALAEANATITRIADTDVLTGLANRRRR